MREWASVSLEITRDWNSVQHASLNCNFNIYKYLSTAWFFAYRKIPATKQKYIPKTRSFVCAILSFQHALYSQRQRYITIDSQSVSKSWCRAQSGTFDQRFFFFKVTVLSFWGALSNERSGLSFVSLLSIESKVVSEFTYIIYNDIYIICVRHSSVIYNLYKIYNIQGLSQFRLFTADYALVTSKLLYYGSLDTWPSL
jgi:hypothetical protein